VVIFIPLLIELKYHFSLKRKFNIKFEISWGFLLIYAVVVSVVYYASQIKLSNDQYQNAMNSTFTIVIPLAIINISALFILLQKNYDKFSSTFLINQILKSPELSVFAFFPSIFIVLNVALTDSNIKYDFLPLTILLLCFLSSIFLIIYFKTVLETNAMLRKLMTSVTRDNFDNYKENIVPLNETNIDAILKIVQAVINCNDVPRAQSTFYSLFFWINKNIANIKYESKYFLAQRNNRFNNFLSTITHELLSSNNIIMHNYYLYSIQDLIISSVTSENYEDYKIIYIALQEYLLKRLQRQEEEYAKEIYETIYRHSSTILLHLKKRERQNNILDYDLFEFRHIFLEENIRNIINTAIENKCIDFLKDMDIFEDLFVIRNYDNYYNYHMYWDNKMKYLFVDNRNIVRRKNLYLLENNSYFFLINKDYEIFLKSKIHSEEIIEYECYNSIINFVISELEIIYCFAISINRKFIDHDFELIWSECHNAIREKDLKTFELFYSFFTFLLDKIFEKEYKKESPDYGMIYILISRIHQIMQFPNNVYLDITLVKYNQLLKKYPNLNEIEKVKPTFELIEKIDHAKRYEIE
jgi:hypothetical protein